ncbi:GntP family permease, partial [Bradyrhizobium sp. UFLA 03-164]|nr:GntP family permease [Bradyrhizobium uaiense]
TGEGYGGDAGLVSGAVADDQFIRERATSSHEFDPAEIAHGKRSDVPPPLGTAIIPLLVVVGVNLLMSLLILPRVD